MRDKHRISADAPMQVLIMCKVRDQRPEGETGATQQSGRSCHDGAVRVDWVSAVQNHVHQDNRTSPTYHGTPQISFTFSRLRLHRDGHPDLGVRLCLRLQGLTFLRNGGPSASFLCFDCRRDRWSEAYRTRLLADGPHGRAGGGTPCHHLALFLRFDGDRNLSSGASVSGSLLRCRMANGVIYTQLAKPILTCTTSASSTLATGRLPCR